MPRLSRILAVTAAAFLLLCANALAAAQPYQQNDFKGFTSILPPGQNGFVSGPGLVAFLGDNSQRPPHNNDQLAMYENLVYATPGLKAADIPKYFKDGSFGVKDGDLERSYSPRADVTIERDKGFGVPHIYGDTREGAMYGAGYVAAEDRLFFIDVLRHVGRAELSSFAGGSQGNRDMDHEQWTLAPYTEADLQRQIDQLDDLYGADGARIQSDIHNYTEGVNQYISELRLNGTKLPGEYSAVGRPQGPDDWKDTDTIAIAALVGGIFGKGGGAELGSSAVYQQAVARFGPKRGPRVWSDFRSQNDPEAPTTIHGKTFHYELVPKKVAKGSVARPDSGSFKPTVVSSDTSSGGGGGGGGGGGPCVLVICVPTAQSNALVVAGRNSKSGHPLAVFGPQVGYFSPQILMEVDIHAPGIDARGAAFPGVNEYVQLGRGRDYAWSATSAGQDLIDTFAVDLCNADGSAATIDSDHYMFRGQCLPIEQLTRTNSWTPNAADQTAPGSETLTIGRTALGIVVGRGNVKGKPVAYTSLRTTYGHEVDSARGFADFNDPGKMKSPQGFQRAASKIGYTFNWLYADDRDIAYFNSGANPVRSSRVDPNFPVRGRTAFEWRGFDPTNRTAQYTPFAQHPRVVNQSYLTSWNNKQAPGYSAADSNFGFSSVYRSDSLDAQVKKRLKGGKKMTLPGLIDSMEVAGSTDLRATQVMPYALAVLGKPKDPALLDAVTKLKAWQHRGGLRRDGDHNGAYDDAEAIRILDAWWPRWIESEFKPTLGQKLYDAIVAMIGLDNEPNNHGGHLGSAYQNGWYGYASKDLRTVLRRKVKGKYSRVYCGRGKLAGCRSVLAASLKDALAHSSADELYAGDKQCSGQTGDALQMCWDAIVHRPLGGVTQPKIHWINRPTYQQADEIQGHRPR